MLALFRCNVSCAGRRVSVPLNEDPRPPRSAQRPTVDTPSIITLQRARQSRSIGYNRWRVAPSRCFAALRINHGRLPDGRLSIISAFCCRESGRQIADARRGRTTGDGRRAAGSGRRHLTTEGALSQTPDTKQTGLHGVGADPDRSIRPPHLRQNIV